MYQVGARRIDPVRGSLEGMLTALESAAGSVVSDHLGGDMAKHDPAKHDPAKHDPAKHGPAERDPATREALIRDSVARRIDPNLLEDCLSLGNTLLGVYLYWASKVSWAQVPSREDLSPLEIPRFLPFLGLVDFLRTSGEFRYRLIGTAITDVSGKDATGAIVGGKDDPSPFGRLDEAAFAEGAHQTRIIYSRRKLISLDGRAFRFDRLALPLRGKSGSIDMLLFVHDCDWWVSGGGDPPPHPVDLFMPVPARSIKEITEEKRYSVSPVDVLGGRAR